VDSGLKRWKCCGESYEIGTGKMYSNQEVREIVEEVTGKKANVRLVDSMRTYDTSHWVADTRAMDDLGWQAKKGLFQTITEMVKYGS